MQSGYVLFISMKVSEMLLQYLYFLFVKLSIIIFCEMSCVLLLVCKIIYYYFSCNVISYVTYGD